MRPTEHRPGKLGKTGQPEPLSAARYALIADRAYELYEQRVRKGPLRSMIGWRQNANF